MAHFTPNNIQASYDSISKLNSNFTKIAELFEKCLFRDGTAPNSMLADLDFNHFSARNLGAAIDQNDAVRLADLQAAMPALDGSSLSALGSDIGAAMVGTNEGISVQAKLNTLASGTFDNSVSVLGSFALNDLGTTTPANGMYVGVGGNSLSFATRISNPSGGADTDNQRASMLVAATTSDDNNSEEQTFCILTTVQTGLIKPYAASTAYSLNDNVQNDTNTYRCIQAGTTAAGGGGPTGKGSSIADGTVIWKWINDAAINAKVGLYNEVEVKPGAGHTWAQANNLQIESGVTSDFIVNSEFDLTNNSGSDSGFGTFNKYGAYIVAQGANKSTSGLEIATTNTSTDALLWGLHFSGTKLASQSIIGVDASGAVGIGIGNAGGAGGAVAVTFSTAGIVEGSTSPKGLSLAGTYSSSSIEASGTSPTALSINGNKTLASLYDSATSPTGILLQGTYSVSQITGTGFSVTPLGNIVLTPAASATPVSNGEMTFQLTSNTSLTIKVKGSDGVVRSTTLTLA